MSCVDNVLKAFPDADKKDVQALYDSLSQKQKDIFLKGSTNPTKEFMELAQKELENYRKGVMIAKIKTLENIAKERSVKNYMKNPIFKSPAEGLLARLYGTFKKVEGGRFSVDTAFRANKETISAAFLKEVGNRSDLIKIFQSGALDLDIRRELFELAKENGAPGITKSSQALTIAKGLKKAYDVELVMKNDSGAFINKVEGYAGRRTYNAEAVKAMGEAGFIEKMLSFVDYDKSFKRGMFEVDPIKSLKETYEKIINEEIDVLHASDANEIIKIVGTPANMARNLEKGRSYVFKSAEAEHEFAQIFGDKTISQEFERSITNSARSAALMQAFGTNPKATIEKLTIGMSDADKAAVNRAMAEVTGKTSVMGVSPMAKWSSGIRKATDFTLISKAVLSSFPDLAMKAGVLQAGGKNIFGAISESFSTFLNNVPKESREEMARAVYVGSQSIINDVFERFGSSDAAPGLFSRMHRSFFKYTGQNAWTNINLSSTVQMLSNQLAENSGKQFSQLNPKLGTVLSKYGIGPNEWKLINGAVESADGVKFVGAEGVMNTPNSVIAGIIGKPGEEVKQFAIDRFRRATAQKLTTYYRDRADIAMSMAGAREKAMVLNRGTVEDSIEGQAMRFIMQYKSYPITSTMKFGSMFKNEVWDEANGPMEKLWSITPLMASLTALGYLSGAAHDITKGRSPKDWRDKDTAMDALVRGGVGGIYGDFILGEFDSRHGRSMLSKMAGPVLGKTDDVADLWNQMKDAGLEGDPSKVRMSAVLRFAANTGIGNMIFVRQAIDYLFLNDLAEQLNPGYNKRMKASMEKFGQEPILDGEGEY